MNCPATTKSLVNNPKHRWIKIIFAFLILCSVFNFSVFAQNEPMDEEFIETFMIRMRYGLTSNLSGQDAYQHSHAIQERWAAKNLVGKTRKEAMEMLFEDVKLTVTDEAILKKIWDVWNEVKELDSVSTTALDQNNPQDGRIPAPTSTATSNQNNTQGETLNAASLQPFMSPIMFGLVSQMQVPTSDPNWFQIGQDNLKAQNAIREKWATRDLIGKTKEEARVILFEDVKLYVKDEKTLKKIWDFWNGVREPDPTSITTSNQINPTNTTNPTNPTNTAEKIDLGARPLSNRDMNKVMNWIAVRTSALRLPFCWKQTYTRGAGYALWNEDKCKKENKQGCEKDGALWYPNCKSGMNGVAFVCWQKCPRQQSFDCGAACSTNQKECAFAVGKMVAAPLIAAVNIATLGTASAATSPAKAASVSKMKQAYNSVKSSLSAAKGDVVKAVGGAQNFKKIKESAEVGEKTLVASFHLGRQVDLFSKEFANTFEEMTSKEIAGEIDRRFGKEAAYEIKRQWGLRHLNLMLQADGFQTANNLISAVSVLDPTGLVSVVESFLHPICQKDSPFPKVTALYNR